VQFSHAISLEGHEDWIRCLSFTSYPSSSSSSGADLLLASGSQDNYIRLWRVSAASSPSRSGDTAGKTEGSGADQCELSLDMLDEFERKLAGEAGGSVQISTKAHVLAVEDLSG
jgi:elongator complex protein 2